MTLRGALFASSAVELREDLWGDEAGDGFAAGEARADGRGGDRGDLLWKADRADAACLRGHVRPGQERVDRLLGLLANRLQHALGQVRIIPNPGSYRLLDEGLHRLDHLLLFGQAQEAEHACDFQAGSQSRPAALPLVDTHPRNPALQGELNDRGLASVQGRRRDPGQGRAERFNT